ncbi:GroES-like protein [Alternaria alternata]|uniref:GroES-like protein n=1 Tax=Alternaria alternata TaxID=5599 RepID=A0A177DYU7_ALTAL|nr:GroES-like protein [Alternaria alternata]OAG24883.1 GroES-like protein [Alternaria alternata]
MVINRAAFIKSASSKILEVEDTPFPTPERNEVVVRNHAVALNPIDWKLLAFDDLRKMVIKTYPFVNGGDVAGIVEAVGDDVTRFRKGQRVFGHPISLSTGKSAHGGFQNYTAIPQHLVWEAPDHVSFNQATVLLLAISTAAIGLYRKEDLGLPLPSLNPVATGKTLLVWGGASSVGGTAIQLAVASGLRVVTTASTSNHDGVRLLGASDVFDYRSVTVARDVAAALADADVVGVFDAVSEEASFGPIIEILRKIGKTDMHVVSVLPLFGNIQERLPGVKHTSGLLFTTEEHVYKHMQDFIPRALAGGQLLPKPDPLVVGNGLDKIQKGLTELQGGVSARKVVVEL